MDTMRLIRERALASRRWLTKSFSNFYEFVQLESCMHRLDKTARRVTFEYERILSQLARGNGLESLQIQKSHEMEEHVHSLLSMIDGSGDAVFGCDLLELLY